MQDLVDNSQPSVAQGLYLFAQKHERDGNFALAENLYRQMAELDKQAGEPAFRLGVVCLRQNKLLQAAEFFQRCLSIHHKPSDAWNLLGVAWGMQGSHAQAERAFRRAVENNPKFADAYANLGISLRELGRLQEAAESLLQALQLQPNNLTATENLACVCELTGDLDAAIAYMTRALQSQPNNSRALKLLFALKVKQQQSDFAQGKLAEGEFVPNVCEQHLGLGLLLADQENFDEAIEAYQKALQCDASLVSAHVGLGNALHHRQRFDEAEKSLQTALELDPQSADAHHTLGAMYLSAGDVERSIRFSRQTLVLAPDHAPTHLNLGLAFLKSGDWIRGFQEYEWRWYKPELRKRTFCQPVWNGGEFRNQKLLIYGEQGLGDTIQFCRFARLAKQLGGEVILECPQTLIPLLKGCHGIDQFVAAGSILPEFDLHAPLMSLPRIFGTTPANVPSRIPYLVADPDRIRRLQVTVPSTNEFKIGIHWQGNEKYVKDRRRSVPLTLFEPLSRIEGVQLVSLQKGSGSEEIATLPPSFHVFDLASRLDLEGAAFVDTAAVMNNLDLIVSVDSAPAHVAGALGLPVWVPLAFSADWRWLLDREDTPWYPTMRLFRQTSRGDWAGVFQRMATALSELLDGRAKV